MIGLLILTVVLAAAGTGIWKRRSVYDANHYTEDYSELYQNQLRIIFGENATIGEKETVVMEGEDCDCGYHSESYSYNQWKISYQDEMGQSFMQTLNNKDSLESQQLSWLNSQLRQYYTQKYLIDFFEEGTFEDLSTGEGLGRTYCSVGIGNPVGSYTSDKKEEYDRIQKAGKEYKERLLEEFRHEDGMLRLYQVDYGTIFNYFPIRVSFHLSIDDGMLLGTEKEAFERAVWDRVMEMVRTIKQETGGACNLRIQINSAHGHGDLYDGARDWRYFILQGERIEPENTFDGFEWALFDAFEGIYW